MRWSRLAALVMLVTLWPSAAHAAQGWWAWLEELSGPGPFHGYVLAAPVLCTRDGVVVPCWMKQSADGPERLLVLSVGRLGSGDNVRFKDLPDTPDNRREVNVLQISGSYMFRLHPAIDVGFGAGTMRLSGEGFKPLWRFTLIPGTMSVRPLALIKQWQDNHRWAYIVRGEIETSFVTGGFNAADFGSSTSTFRSGPEFLTRAAVVVDFGSLIWGW